MTAAPGLARARVGVRVLAGLLAAAPLLVAPARAMDCREAAAAAERAHGLPTGLLQAMSKQESGHHPFAIGAPPIDTPGADQRPTDRFPATLAEAVREVRRLQAAGQTLLDVGCLQVNLRWHPDAFASLADAFDPATNAEYAGRHLAALRQRLGSWTEAVKHYHASAKRPDRQRVYALSVTGIIRRMIDGREDVASGAPTGFIGASPITTTPVASRAASRIARARAVRRRLGLSTVVAEVGYDG